MTEEALERQRKYEHRKYHADLTHHFMKRYQSRADNFFKNEKHKAIDLLPQISFFKWIKFCLRDAGRARIPLNKIELGHVRPVTTFDENDLSGGWNWMNVLPMLESESLEQKNDRIPKLETQQLKRVIRFLKETKLKHENIVYGGTNNIDGKIVTLGYQGPKIIPFINKYGQVQDWPTPTLQDTDVMNIMRQTRKEIIDEKLYADNSFADWMEHIGLLLAKKLPDLVIDFAASKIPVVGQILSVAKRLQFLKDYLKTDNLIPVR